MYHVGQPTKRHQRIRRLLVGLAVLVVVVGAWGISRMLRPDTVIHGVAPSTTHVAIATQQTQKVSKPGFSMLLPDDWKPVVDPQATPSESSWGGSNKTDSARRLDVYVDTLPTTMAVNRMLPLQAQGEGVMPLASVSDNCVNFTDKATADAQTSIAPAKWSGISFWCDTANTLRDVVGTSSADGINTVKVTTTSGKTHSYFFVYTDHTAQPDVDVFTTILASFKAQ